MIDEIWAVTDEARAALLRLQQAWPWLAEVRVPGTAAYPVERRLDPRNAAREAEVWRRDRQNKLLMAARGIKATGAHADAGRVGPISARHEIARDLRGLVEELHRAVGVTDYEFAILDPTGRVHTTLCGWCEGAGHLSPPPDWAWEWPEDAVQCPRCLGRGEHQTPAACEVCGHVGSCDCDHSDAVVNEAFGLLPVLIMAAATLGSPDDVIYDALRVLERCDRLARAAAGVAEDRRVIKAPCPACGRRELYAEVSSVDRTAWVIRCEHPACECTGAGCSCGREVRAPGRRHLWPAREWDGPAGLAARLGVDLPGTARVEVSA